jgi:CHAT domain-containing protein/tetratricopeptide (TPR) repeat protein
MQSGPPLFRHVLWVLIAASTHPILARYAAAQPDRGPNQDIPPWKRPLSGEAAARVAKLEQQIAQLQKEGKFAEAIEPAHEVAEIRTRLQGADHWQTADARRAVDDLRQIAALPEEGRTALASVADLAQKAEAEGQLGHYAESERIHRTVLEIRRKWLGESHPDTARSYYNIGYAMNEEGKSVAAEPLYHKALAIWLKALGEGHPLTALGYNELAFNLNAQAKYAEAEPLFRQALAIDLKTLGEDHPGTAGGYNNVAFTLNAQGKHAAAEPLYRKALASLRKLLGEGHPDTALGYDNLALNLDAQGKYTEAEALHRQALAIYLKARGEDHPHTALGYNNLAFNLYSQGKYAEAQPLFRQALAIDLKARGEDHPHAALGYHNLAANLDRQAKYAEAELLYRQALAIDLKVLGEGHPDTAYSYNNLAANLDAQENHTEAEPLHRRALAIRLKALGKDHPHTAQSYSNLAANLDDQGKHAAAEPLYRRALAIYLKALGEGHPDTARNYNDLSANLDAQGKLVEAGANWTAALAVYERTRGGHGVSGLERSVTPHSSPRPALAIALARQGQLRSAWVGWEADLARGLLDDLSARLLRPLTAEEHRREADLTGGLQRFDERITRLATKARRTQEEDKLLDALRNQQSALRGQWVEFQNEMDRQYQALAGKPSTLDEVQKALPRDAALVGWLDVRKHHWACIVRHEGDPLWVNIPGSGQDGAWAKEDDERPTKVRAALADHQPGWSAPAKALARQRLAPLMPHLKSVKHLIVLPSRSLAGVPIEALVAALPDGSAPPVVSYAPSGSMFARLRAPHSQPSGPPRLLALGDPAFPKAAPNRPAPAPPDHGIPILAVAPHGVADLFDLRPGDVVLEYNGKVLSTVKDLAIVPAGDKPLRIPIKLWRDGEIRALELAAGELGIQSNPNRPTAQVVLAQRAAAEVLSSGVRAAGWAPLPGTRREVQALAALFPKDQVTTLLGPDATESNLQQLAQSGALKSYRFVHLATHGQANPRVALSSAVLLAAEPDRPADPAALESAPDGQVTAEQIVRTWELDADLVVLSACESGLGRYAGGEGYLGFAQALFVTGAHSLVLSQWKVDDKATALLMARFYQNLLGKRSGLSQPLPKAEALDEAKRWLRELTVDEVGSELAALDRGVVRPLAKADGPAPHDASRTELVQRGLGEVAVKLPEGGRIVPPSTPKATGVRPYAHPYYWASFILIGDPR